MKRIEAEYVEFKESTSQTSRALEAIAAMLNKHGTAKVMFGIKDNGEVIGQEIGSKTILDLSQTIASRIKPVVIPSINIELIDNKPVIVVSASGNNKPYSADGEYRIRFGNENRKIEPELLKELIFTNSTELITSMEAINQDLTFNQLKQLYIMHGLSFNDKTFEKNIGLLCKSGKYNELADILSDNNNCSIKVVRFAGKDKSELLVRNEYGYKCMILAMQQALDYTQSFNETRVIMDGNAQRKEIKLFDEKCLREAWTNACLHNRWDKRIPPAIYIFSDRIEIVSTGGLPIDFSKEEFFDGVSHPTNIQLQKIMGQLATIEQTGHGVPKIVKKYGKDAFSLMDNHITVTLKFPYEININNVNNERNLAPSKKKVLDSIKVKPSITVNEISNVTSLSIPRINQIIKELKNENLLERIGSNKSGYWKIKK